jgi:small subunit ribosomal protein S1
MDSEETMVGQQTEAPPEDIVCQETGGDGATAEETGTEARPSTVEALKPGMRVKGRVRNIVEFGAFVDIGVGRDGLAHVSTLQRAGIDKTLKVGDLIDVQVRRIDADSNRISLTVPGAGKGAKTALNELQVGEQVTGRVVRLVDFGAFVDIGAQSDGLLHISRLSGGFVRHPSEVLRPGDEVQVRILEIDAQRRRISLTMKSDAAPEMELPEPVQEAAEDRSGGVFAAAWERALHNRRERVGARR